MLGKDYTCQIFAEHSSRQRYSTPGCASTASSYVISSVLTVVPQDFAPVSSTQLTLVFMVDAEISNSHKTVYQYILYMVSKTGTVQKAR